MKHAAIAILLAGAAAWSAPRSRAATVAAPRATADDAAATASAPPSVCAVLSLNARGVTARAVAEAEKALGAEAVFATSSLREAAAAAKVIESRRYDVVVAGGGDGTLGALLKDLRDAYREPGDDDAAALARLPAIAALPGGNELIKKPLSREMR